MWGLGGLPGRSWPLPRPPPNAPDHPRDGRRSAAGRRPLPRPAAGRVCRRAQRPPASRPGPLCVREQRVARRRGGRRPVEAAVPGAAAAASRSAPAPQPPQPPRASRAAFPPQQPPATCHHLLPRRRRGRHCCMCRRRAGATCRGGRATWPWLPTCGGRRSRPTSCAASAGYAGAAGQAVPPPPPPPLPKGPGSRAPSDGHALPRTAPPLLPAVPLLAGVSLQGGSRRLLAGAGPLLASRGCWPGCRGLPRAPSRSAGAIAARRPLRLLPPLPR